MTRIQVPILPLILALVLVAVTRRAEAQGPCLRSEDPMMESLVSLGIERSATFRDMLDRLEQSNLIVHVERASSIRQGTGMNRFVSAVGARRFLRITLNVAQATNEAVALLGHELQHAVELAEEPRINDARAYEMFYRRIGYESCARASRCFETVAAVETGQDVLRELRRRPTDMRATGRQVAHGHRVGRRPAVVTFLADADVEP